MYDNINMQALAIMDMWVECCEVFIIIALYKLHLMRLKLKY